MTPLVPVALALGLTLAAPPLQDLGPALAVDNECTAGGDDPNTCGLKAMQRHAGRGLGATQSPYIQRTLVADEGKHLRQASRIGLPACAELCDSLPACRSFTYGLSGPYEGGCYLKDKVVNAGDAMSMDPWKVQRFVTFYEAPPASSIAAVPGYIERSLVKNEGLTVGSPLAHTSPLICALSCDVTPRCCSFTISLGGNDAGTCYMKDRIVSASDPPSTHSWNKKAYKTYYKGVARKPSGETSVPEEPDSGESAHEEASGGGPAPEPPSGGSPANEAAGGPPSDYGEFALCNRDAIVMSSWACRQASKELGYGDQRANLVPYGLEGIPPGCFYARGVAGLGDGVWFNRFGLTTASGVAQEGIRLLCKRMPYKRSKVGSRCVDGEAVSSEEGCKNAAELLGLGSVGAVGLPRAAQRPFGCFEVTSGESKGIWFNPIRSSFGGDTSDIAFICKS